MEEEIIEETDDEEFTFSQMQEEVRAEREEETQQEEAEMKKFADAVDEKGDWKSVKHQQDYYDEKEPAMVGGPNPEHYKDEYLYEADRESYLRTGRLAHGLTPFPDDEHSEARRDLTNQILEHRRKAVLAESRNDREGVNLHSYHAKAAEEELLNLPEPPAVTAARENNAQQRENSLQGHFEGAYSEDFGNAGRLAHDSAIEASRHIQEGESSIIYLPTETSRFGNLEVFHPKNVIRFDLPPDVADGLRQAVHNQADKTPDSIFRAAYRYLHTSGHSSLGKRSPIVKSPKGNKAKSKISRDPADMSLKEYEKWAEKRGMRRF